MESCPPTAFNRSFMLVKPSPAPHGFVRVEAGARVLDCQIDGVDLTVQRHVGVSRGAMLEDILEGFLQDAVRQREISGGSASGMFSKCTSIVTSCRFDNSPHNRPPLLAAPGVPVSRGEGRATTPEYPTQGPRSLGTFPESLAQIGR